MSERPKPERSPAREGSSQLFGALLDAAVDGIIVIDERGTIREINSSGLGLFGHTADNLIGHNVNVLMPRRYAEQHDEYIDNYLQTGRKKIIGIGREVEGLRADGTVFPMDLSVGEGLIEGKRFFIGIVRDLTERQALTHQLHERESEVRGLIENALVATGAIDRDGNFLSWNDSFERVFRTSDLSEASITEFLSPAQAETLATTIRSLVDNAGFELLTNQRFMVEDGDAECVGDLFLSAIVDMATPGARIERLVVQFVDRTSEIEAERKAFEAQNHLAHLNRVGTLGEMAAGIAHEVNQPLGAIANYSQAARILLSNPDSDTDRLDSILAKIADQAQRAGEVIRRMRSLAGQHSSIREACRVEPLIEEVVRLFETDARFEIATLDTHIEEDLPYIWVDRVQIQQVLLNLLRNAVDAMKSLPLSERALEIRCTAGSPHPLDTPSVLSNEDAKQGIVIEVVDSGHGIDSGLVDQVMSPFFSTKKDGMGMGLAICHSILSAHDGQITFRNNLSQPGTTFRLFLPRSNQGSSP